MAPYPMDPDVTVVLPTHDRWPLLARALTSVLGQKDVTLEVIVIDDGSSDETPERLREIADERVLVLTQPENAGVAAARNRGIAAAKADWIAFLDDDDYWGPRHLAEHLSVAATAGADWVYGPVILVNPAGVGYPACDPPPPVELARRLLDTNVVGTPSTVSASTKLLREVGGFDERFSVLADWDLWLRLDQQGRAARSLSRNVAQVIHSDNMQMRDWDRIRTEFRVMAGVHRCELEAAGQTDFTSEGTDRWMADNHRRARRRVRGTWAYLQMAARYRIPRDLAVAAAVLVGTQDMSRRIKREARAVGPLLEAPDWILNGWSERPAGSQRGPRPTPSRGTATP